MPRKESMTIAEGNGPTPQCIMPGEITLEDFPRAVSEMWGEGFRELKEDLRSLDQLLASL